MADRNSPGPKKPVVLSAEQALSMPYATQRFVQLGWRVIRIEPTPVDGRKSRGDPNRYIGRPVAGQDRHSYFVAANAGKEAVAIDFKRPEGRELLGRLLDGLGADVFCTNTLPARHESLGIDPDTLRKDRPRLVWAGISAMGRAYPDVPGYDPMVQALAGYMDLTGDPGGPPMQCGIPLVDLKAGDEVFAQTLRRLWERETTGEGGVIDVSMARVAVSWLPTFLPMLDMGSPPEELKRSGNEHRQFIPDNAYPVSDGFLYVAVGSDAQWARLVEQPLFAALKQDRFASNEGRRKDKTELHRAIAGITRAHPSAEVEAVLAKASIPHSRITPIDEVWDLDFVAETALKTQAPDGRTVRLPPAPVDTENLDTLDRTLPFAPAYGEQTTAVLTEAGLAENEIADLKKDGVVA